MIKDARYIIKRVIIGVLICLLLSFIRTCEVKAQNLGIDLYIQNTLMTGRNKLYNGGAQNVSIQLRQPEWELDKNQYLYGYIAICSATGKNSKVNTMSWGNDIQHAVVYTSEETCTIPTTNSYNDTARVMYITYEVDKEGLYQAVDTFYEWKHNLTFTIYQGGATEYALVGFGFSNSPYRVNTESTLNDAILNSQYQKLVTIDSTLTTINGKIDSIISAITNSNNALGAKVDQAGDKVSGKIDATNGKLDRQYDLMKDSNVDNPSGDLEDMNENIATNTVISDLLTLPIRFYQTILNNVNSTCSPYNLGTLFNSNIELPCVNIGELLGDNIFTTIDIGLCGLFVWSIRKKFISIFQNITSLTDRGNELE